MASDGRCVDGVQVVPQALTLAIEENVEMRKGLPLDFLHYMGIVHQDKVGGGKGGGVSGWNGGWVGGWVSGWNGGRVGGMVSGWNSGWRMGGWMSLVDG